MSDVTTDFFTELADGGYQPILRRAKGSLRIELESGQSTERWLLVMDRGTVAVSRRQGRADCVIRADREVFEKLVTGQLNMLTAALRGLFRMEGDNVELMVLFQRYVGSRRHALATGRAGGGSDD